MLEIFRFLHDDHKIAHRDAKPDNFIVDGDNAVKLIDFNVSRRHEKGQKMMT